MRTKRRLLKRVLTNRVRMNENWIKIHSSLSEYQIDIGQGAFGRKQHPDHCFKATRFYDSFYWSDRIVRAERRYYSSQTPH